MSILIKGRQKPKNCLMCQFHGFGGYKNELIVCSLTGRSEVQPSNVPNCPIVEVPTPHGRLIDADVLYENTAEWEAQAFHMVIKTMNDEDKSEWRRWSWISAERSAFKYDVADAPTIIEAEEGANNENL